MGLDEAADGTSWWSRILYDRYNDDIPSANGTAARPLIVDADDCTSQPDLPKTLAASLGLDTSAVVTQWQVASEEEKPDWIPVKVKIDKSRRVLDIDVEAIQWKAEFGENEALKIRALVSEEMQHYNYL